MQVTNKWQISGMEWNGMSMSMSKCKCKCKWSIKNKCKCKWIKISNKVKV